jgi:uncharacterized protein YeeX (DUF496 family)
MSNKEQEENEEIQNENVELPTNMKDLHIEVYNPQIREDTFNKYVVYSIKGTDTNGPFEVIRRYSDFDKVRALLLAKWPGCYIPPLPPKALNSLEAKVVRERKKYLNRFCQKIAELPYLHYYEGYQEFLRTKNPSVEKALAPFLKQDYEEIINRYINTFSELGGKEYNAAVVKKIADFKVFLKKMEVQSKTLKKFARSMVKAKINFYQEFAFLNGLVTMQYEKAVFSQLNNGDESLNVFFDTKAPTLYQHAEKVEEGSKKPSLEYIEEWMKAEAREIEAFLDAIAQKEHFNALRAKAQTKQKGESNDLQKVLGGGTTMKGLFLRKNKEEEIGDLEKSIAKHSKDFDDLTRLDDMITLVIAYEEIDKFKGNKMNPYYNIIRIAAHNELETLTNMEQYWSTVLTNKNITSLAE